jgi:putative endonuclease
MAAHNELGKYGEQLARVYLTGEDFKILFQNWRHSYYEIDIICSKEEVLHFIEIKTRRSLAFGYPEEDVDEKKLEKLMIAGEEFLFQYPEWDRVQYDVLSIYLPPNRQPEFLFIQDVAL